jgi:hypothetical protein
MKKNRTIQVPTNVTVIQDKNGKVTYDFQYGRVGVTLPDGTKVILEFVHGSVAVTQLS